MPPSTNAGRVPRITGRYKTGRRPATARYNSPRRNQLSLRIPDAFLDTLRPLQLDHCVTLTMDDPKLARLKLYKGPKYRIVVITPGPIFGAPRGAFLISIVGTGSCVIKPRESRTVANLVLAGMPANLANVLMDKLHRVLQE